MKTASWLLLLLMIAACATILGRPPLAPPERQELPVPTLAVTNLGPYDFTVLLDGVRIGNAPAGVVSCIRLRNVDPVKRQQLAVRALGSRRLIQAPLERFVTARGWRMTLGQSPAIEVNSLQPAAACA